MRCQRCGRVIGNRSIEFNGVMLCEMCARELKLDDVVRNQMNMLEQSFPILNLNEITNSLVNSVSGLEFSNTKIRCPRCQTTLRELETTGTVGCIECYNYFNETILKGVLKRQGTDSYKGRKPGEMPSLSGNDKSDDVSPDETKGGSQAASAGVNVESPKVGSEEKAGNEDVAKGTSKKESTGKSNVGRATARKTKKTATTEDRLEKIKKSDLGMMSDKDLEKAMKDAVEKEDYVLAARLRDELKSRKEGN